MKAKWRLLTIKECNNTYKWTMRAALSSKFFMYQRGDMVYIPCKAWGMTSMMLKVNHRIEEEMRSYPMYADISASNKRSCLQFHMSSPCAILFHGLTVFIKWDIILDEGFKHFTVHLLSGKSENFLQVESSVRRKDGRGVERNEPKRGTYHKSSKYPSRQKIC